MLTPLLETLIKRINLDEKQISAAISHLLNPDVPVAQKSAFLVLLKAKGETVSEMIAFIRELKKHMQSFSLNVPVLDIVGTGGDGLKTINLSTGAALLAAACGVSVAKHGNRAVSSHCGSADVLEALNIPIHLPEKLLISSIENHQFGFCFAPLFQPALKVLQPLRRTLGISTIFNCLGPFLNPANAQHYVLGVHSRVLLPKFAEILRQLKVKKSVVVHTPLFNSSQGMDEVSTVNETLVAEVSEEKIFYYTLHAKNFNLPSCDITELQSNSVTENVDKLMEAFSSGDGKIADNLALNAGLGLYIYGRCDSIEAGVSLAQEKLKNGSVIRLIHTLVSSSGSMT